MNGKSRWVWVGEFATTDATKSTDRVEQWFLGVEVFMDHPVIPYRVPTGDPTGSNVATVMVASPRPCSMPWSSLFFPNMDHM